MGYTPVSAPEFDALGLVDWRYAVGTIQALFRAGSFPAAAALAGRIAALAEERDHHPDIDIRYPDRVFVTLVTHAADDLTTHDTDLAVGISQLAADANASSEPLTPQFFEVAIDAIDIPAVRPFWEAVLAYKPDQGGGLIDPLGRGPAVWFQQMEEPRPQRNRIHFDVTVPHEIAEERVAAAVAAGGHVVSDARARAFWVLADAEGNEVCICTWQDR